MRRFFSFLCGRDKRKVTHTSPQVRAPALTGWWFCSAGWCNFSHQLPACRSTPSSDWSSISFHSTNHRLDPWFQVPLLNIRVFMCDRSMTRRINCRVHWSLFKIKRTILTIVKEGEKKTGWTGSKKNATGEWWWQVNRLGNIVIYKSTTSQRRW